MHPLLWEHPPVTGYGAMIVLGLAAAWIVARGLARRAGVGPWKIDLLAPLLTGAGLAGAALFGWLADRATGTPAHGTVLLGSLLLATGAGIGFALVARIPLGVLGDIFASPVMIGVALGRIGCFLAGCCYGRVCTGALGGMLGVVYPRDSFVYFAQLGQGLLGTGAAHPLAVYPVQLFESAGAAVLAGVLGMAFGRRKVSGELFLRMALGYAGLRFGLEFLRGDNPPVLGVLTFSQVVCGLVMVVSGATLVWRRRNAARWGLGVAACEGPGEGGFAHNPIR